jgi:hypothetical protein
VVQIFWRQKILGRFSNTSHAAVIQHVILLVLLWNSFSPIPPSVAAHSGFSPVATGIAPPMCHRGASSWRLGLFEGSGEPVNCNHWHPIVSKCSATPAGLAQCVRVYPGVRHALHRRSLHPPNVDCSSPGISVGDLKILIL